MAMKAHQMFECLVGGVNIIDFPLDRVVSVLLLLMVQIINQIR